MGIIGLWWVTSHGKGTAPGRLVAWGVMLVVVWGFIDASNVTTATAISGDAAHGIVTAGRGFTAFARDVLGS
jgi:hypothetical protein